MEEAKNYITKRSNGFTRYQLKENPVNHIQVEDYLFSDLKQVNVCAGTIENPKLDTLGKKVQWVKFGDKLHNEEGVKNVLAMYGIEV